MYHPTNKGFFPLLALRVEQSLSIEEKFEFDSKKSLPEKLIYINSLPRLNGDDPTFNVFSQDLMKPNFGEKSVEKSTTNREAGNAQFYSGNYRQAQLLYSVAVFHAPQPSSSTPTPKESSQHFALALANRSACMQKMNSFQCAIEDIDLSLASGYPLDKAFKLYERKGECLQQLAKTGTQTEKEKRLEGAVEAFRLSIKYLQSKSGLGKEKVAKFSLLVQKKIDETNETLQLNAGKEILNGNAQQTNGNKKPDELDNFLPMDPSSTFPCFQSSMEIRYEEGRGRYAVAARDIPLGTTLIKETPLSYALHPERYGTHCQNCLTTVRSVVPCRNCSWVCFCSLACRDAAATTYHKHECGIMKLLLESGLNVYSFLTMRAVCTQGLEALLAMKEDLEGKRSEATGAGLKDGVYRSDDFRNLYNLMAHETTITPDEWFLRTLVAIFILRSLKNSGFFGGKPAPKGDYSMTDDELFVATVILRLINVCPCNCHDISEFESPTLEKFGPACTKVSIGAGMFPTLALFNHSCDPSFMRCNRGRLILCVANRLIKAGEEITENYGLMYTSKNFDERQQILLNHYKFECLCTPCIEKWSSLTAMSAEVNLDQGDVRMNRFQKIRCIKCGETIRRKGAHSNPASTKVSCLVCGAETDLVNDIPLAEIKSLARKAVDDLIRGKWKEGLESATRADLLVSKHLSLPLLEIADVQVAIWKCMWLKFGTMKLVKMI